MVETWERDSGESIKRGRFSIARYSVGGVRWFLLWERVGNADVIRGKSMHSAELKRAADVLEGMAANDGEALRDRHDGGTAQVASGELGLVDAA